MSRQSKAGSIEQTPGPKEGALSAGALLVSERLACSPAPLDLVPLSLLLLSLPVSPGECCPPLRAYPRVAMHQSKARG